MKHSNILDAPLMRLAENDSVTVRDLCAGTFVSGMTGGGKSTGPANTLLRAFFRSGMGGVITTAKPDDVENIRRLCAKEGRSKSLIVWDGRNGGFNFLAWTLALLGSDGIDAAIEFLMRVVEMKRASSATPGGAGDQFWIDAPKQMLRSAVPVIHAATGTVRIEDILRFVRSAPESQAQMKDPDWQERSFFYAACAQAMGRLEDAIARNALGYWHDDWCNLDPKTRGNILISLTTALDALNSGWLREAFCEGTTMVPELCFEGAIIVLDMPVLTRHEEGLLAQQIFVYAYQRAILHRNGLPQRYRERPVFLMVDEFPLFCNSQYAEFLGTCRSSRCCTVLLAQSLPSIYARMGGPNAQDRAHQLIANCATKIFAANSCSVTNEWAAKTIGRVLHQRGSYNESEGCSSNTGMSMGDGTNWGNNSGQGTSFSFNSGSGSGQSSWSLGRSQNWGRSSGGSDNQGRNRSNGTNSGKTQGYTETMDFLLEPGEFGRRLKTGGPANGNRVSAVWFQAGRRFNCSKGPAFMAEFQQ